MKVGIFGVGSYLNSFLREWDIPQGDIGAFIDSNTATINIPYGYDGIPVVRWDGYVGYYKDEIDAIVIGSNKYFWEIAKAVIGYDPSIRIMSLMEWVRRGDYHQRIIDNTELIDNAFLKNARLVSNRDKSLSMIPQGAIVAELGVFRGDFSDVMIKSINPQMFVAIDLFMEDSFFSSNKCSHYQYYTSRFQDYIKKGKMKVLKSLSWEGLEAFPDDYFDYIYIDAGHDYDSVLKDTRISYKKIKHGGIIQYNDYIIYDYVMGMTYGIAAVVNSFINNTKSEVINYCLSKSGFDDIAIRINKKEVIKYT